MNGFASTSRCWAAVVVASLFLAISARADEFDAASVWKFTTQPLDTGYDSEDGIVALHDLAAADSDLSWPRRASVFDPTVVAVNDEMDLGAATFDAASVTEWIDQPEGGAAAGAGGEGGASGLAAKSQNPVSDLASVPYQMNANFGIQPGNRMQYVGNFQPVVPLKLTENWNLIARLIVPTINQPVGLLEHEHGLGDSLGQFFFTQRQPGRLIWGVGPMVMMPTASSPLLGFQEWGAGVAAVGLVSEGPWLGGALVTNVWSFEGATNQFLVQPFLNHNFEKGWFVSVSGEFTADWERPADDQWTMVFGPGFGRVFPIFGQPVNIATRFGGYFDTPDGGPDWQYRLQVTLLFPK